MEMMKERNEEDGRGVGGCGVHLSPWIHQEYTFRHKNPCRTPIESGQEYLTSGKEYTEPCNTTKEGGGNRSLSRTWPALRGWGTEAGVWSPHQGNCLSQRRNFKAEGETADLWQPNCNENQTVLAAAIHTLDRDAGPLEGTVAESWNLGIVEQSQGEDCCWLQRDRSKGCEGGDCGGNACGGKLGSHGSKAILLSHA